MDREERELRQSMDAFKAWRNRPISDEEIRYWADILLNAPPLITLEQFNAEMNPRLDFDDIHFGAMVDNGNL